MSWNLLIHNEGEPLGGIADITSKFNAAFRGLEWTSPNEAGMPDQSIRLEITETDGLVQDIYTHGGFGHIKQLAALCKREGWRVTDAQEGEDVDLEDPQRWYDERS
ncbi:MAG: hypothetical protein RLZZ265_513 [Verrucomicrobiota bacterium]|jgi:hypothetical protein